MFKFKGQDTLSQIGVPTSDQSREITGQTPFYAYQKWADEYGRYFPPTDSGIVEMTLDDGFVKEFDAKAYPEPLIDALFAEKEYLFYLSQ